MHWFPNWSLQLASNSTTLLGMTHSIPNRCKIETHRSLATSQCRKMRSIVSPILSSHLPIVHQFGKSNISLKVDTEELHMICHQSLLTSRNTKQFRKRGLQGKIPTPQIISKSYPRRVSHLMPNKSKKNQKKKSPPPPNGFPHRSPQHLSFLSHTSITTSPRELV